MFRVEVPIASAKDLPQLMSRMREWLDHRHLDVPFECTTDLCRVDFANAADAEIFAAEVGGTVIGDRILPKDVVNNL